jgi:hypothetical protein
MKHERSPSCGLCFQFCPIQSFFSVSILRTLSNKRTQTQLILKLCQHRKDLELLQMECFDRLTGNIHEEAGAGIGLLVVGLTADKGPGKGTTSYEKGASKNSHEVKEGLRWDSLGPCGPRICRAMKVSSVRCSQSTLTQEEAITVKLATNIKFWYQSSS